MKCLKLLSFLLLISSYNTALSESLRIEVYPVSQQYWDVTVGETLSSIAGTTFEDSVLTGASEGVPGTRFFVDFVGIEFSQVTLGDTAMVTQEVEENLDPENDPTVIRLLTYMSITRMIINLTIN